MCGTCEEEGSFIGACDRCAAEICEDCERFIMGCTYCFACAPIVRAEILEEGAYA